SHHTVTVTAGSSSSADPGPAPMELLLVSLATCSAATSEAITDKMRLDVADLQVAVDATRSPATPRVWTDIALRYHIRSEAGVDRLERAVELTARTCSVSVMLARATSWTEELYVVTEIDEESTIDLRHRLLRSGMPRSSVSMSGSEDAVWFGVLHDGSVEGTIGLFTETSPEGDSRHRLRAMATSETIRGSGLGKMLVDALCDRVVSVGGTSVWAAARAPAVAFYSKLGFEITSDEYEVDGIGPHVRMRRAL
ncbi:MAG TPA: GNAT family N-acetyltransferase, partial [Acidimicrobiia bacterium]